VSSFLRNWIGVVLRETVKTSAFFLVAVYLFLGFAEMLSPRTLLMVPVVVTASFLLEAISYRPSQETDRGSSRKCP
jgi:hypothetical protein